MLSTRFSNVLALIALLLAGAPTARASDPAPAVHWAFEKVRKPSVPSVHDSGWVNTPVDAFVLERLEQKDWRPALPASKSDLIRRVYFDVTGLPPSPDAIRSFIADPSPGAYEHLVDQLLSTPQYGERWAQHWLDLVRFAETEGYEYDRNIPDAWRYRDYVIASFNNDKPYDRFLSEQIAGDEIAPDSNECEIASAFNRLGPIRRNAGNPEIALSRNEVLTERADIIGSAFLGMTVGCARCHNHKLEPISQKDYYRLQAYFAASDEHNISLASAEEQKRWEEQSKSISDELKQLRQKVKGAEGEKRMTLTRQIEELEDRLPDPLPTIPATRNNFTNRTEVHVLKRGVWEKKEEAVAPRPPSVLVGEDLPELPADYPQPRTALAKWLASPENPLTARVMVNRLWQHHFGAGLVKSVNDFGTHGDRPSHPELLDWLAATFVENGWHFKPIHRLILLSSAYRQSVHSDAAARYEKEDPENRLLSRFNRRRLSAEEIRDAMLAVAGQLNPKSGGPSVMIPVDEDLVKLLYKPSQWKASHSAQECNRRSVYLLAKRNLRLPFMDTFDAPALLSNCARRESSTHPPQALEMLNGKTSNDLAEAFAARLRCETGGHREKMVDRAFWLALGRAPSQSELAASMRYLLEQDANEKEFALAMFNLNAFLYVQ